MDLFPEHKKDFVLTNPKFKTFQKLSSTMLSRQNAAPPGFFDAVAKYNQELAMRPHSFVAFMQATKDLPIEIKQLIWERPPQPPDFV